MTEKAVRFLGDWFGIAPKHLERAAVALMVIGSVVLAATKAALHTLRAIDAFMIVLGVIFVFAIHRMPKAVRSRKRVAPSGIFARISWQVLLVINIASGIAGDREAIGFGMTEVALIAILYLHCIDVDGERGRKAKMAWSKIKELFGTAWVPRPVGAN